ncbi:MAG: NAD-dependent epimerase/dehydratase family protein [Deltaproteobacteria bacterium]|nr:NAD-dependent epimerase/dehydratase family protein [Deltaproteobacteria bacterium]
MSAIAGSRVFITGGSGLVGSHTVEKLLSRNVSEIIVYDKFINEENLVAVKDRKEVKIVQGDLNDISCLQKNMAGSDFLIHLAGLLLLPSMRNQREALMINIVDTYALMDLALDLGVKKIVYASSVSVYGTPDTDQPVTEKAPFLNRTIYGACKIAVEQLCRALRDMRGLNYVALRYCSVYGPRQHADGLYPRLILKTLSDINKHRIPRIEGTGDEVQDFIYVEDVANANVLALEVNVSDEAYNIVSGTPTTVRELLKMVCELEGRQFNVEFVPCPGKEIVAYRRFNGEKAHRELGFVPKINLEEGLKRLLSWAKTTGEL